MPRNQKKHISWGSVAAYAFFVAYIVMIGVGATLHWRALDFGFAILSLGAIVVGAAIVLWRSWKHRAEPGPARISQVDALPASWRHWVLGEDKDGRPK